MNTRLCVQALGCMLYKMMYYADPFDGKLGILNARYRAPDFPPYTPKMHDLLSAPASRLPPVLRVSGLCTNASAGGGTLHQSFC